MINPPTTGTRGEGFCTWDFFVWAMDSSPLMEVEVDVAGEEGSLVGYGFHRGHLNL